jgi:hypothetical protein
VYSLEYVDIPKDKTKSKNIIGKIFKWWYLQLKKYVLCFIY